MMTTIAKSTDGILQLTREDDQNYGTTMFHVMRLDDTGYHSVYASELFGDVAVTFFQKAEREDREVEYNEDQIRR